MWFVYARHPKTNWTKPFDTYTRPPDHNPHDGYMKYRMQYCDNHTYIYGEGHLFLLFHTAQIHIKQNISKRIHALPFATLPSGIHPHTIVPKGLSSGGRVLPISYTIALKISVFRARGFMFSEWILVTGAYWMLSEFTFCGFSSGALQSIIQQDYYLKHVD